MFVNHRAKEAGAVIVPAMCLAVLLAGCIMPPQEPLLPAPVAGAGGDDPGRGAAPPEAVTTVLSQAGGKEVLRVHFVDVGQGDGVVWKLPGGGFAVYDCGPPVAGAAGNPVVARLRALGLPPGGTLHALVASHGHLDHVGGCEEVL